LPRILTPLRLTREDFDAFVPGSAAVRARLELTPRMLRWARGVARRLEDHGVALRAVAPGFGAGPRKGKGERAQRVLLQEDAGAAGEAAEGGVRLSLRLDGSRVEVALEIPAGAKALLEALADDAWRAELGAAFEALPEPFGLGFGGDSGALPASVDPSAALSLFERGLSTGRSLEVAWKIPRDVATAHSSVLDVELEDGIRALVPIYKLVTHPEAEPKRGRSRGKAGQKPRRPRPAAVPGRSTQGDTLPPFERGARVRVLAGPFAGKVGVVKEVDAMKGRAQVMLGLLATRIDVKDLTANTSGGRPTLSSSHRKPLGLR
jgi:hypothetical protein